jgi:SNF2 family DNA or RNA helicase
MISRQDLLQLERELEDIESHYSEIESEESSINRQITELRAKLSTLTSKRREIKSKRDSVSKLKDSTFRQFQLQEEQEKLNRDFALLKEQMEALVKDALWHPDNPFNMAKIKSWQLEGAFKLANAKRGLLADVRGMGKTLSSLAWRRAVQSKKTLVLTRKRYAKNFVLEINLWEPDITVIPIVAASPLQRRLLTDILSKHEDFIVVGNFEMWRKSQEAISDLLNVGFDGIILDEAHQLKTFKSVTTKGFINLALSIPNLLEMTGTPLQNKPQELFAILHTLYPTSFPDEYSYVRDHCYQYTQNKWSWQYGGLESLMAKISGFYVARRPEDVGHTVPPPAIHEFELDFDGYPEQAAAYRAVAEQALLELKSGKVLPITSQLTLMMRQSQLTSWPAGISIKIRDEEGEIIDTIQYDVHQSVKLDWAEDLIKELVEEGHRVVLFSRFLSGIYELEQRLIKADISTGVITGRTKQWEQDEIVEDFDLKTAPENPRFSVLLASYDTVSEAVNLNAARHLIQLDRYWKSTRDDQAIGRIDRLNSMDQATVYRAHVDKTIDVYMINLIEQKKEMLSEFKTAAEQQNELIQNLEESLS